MKLLTKAIEKKLPAIYSTEGAEDSKVVVKFFNPAGAGTWYATEYDGEDTFFGYVTGLGYDELGYFSLSELAGFKGPFGIGIERDLHWDSATPLKDVKAGETI
jgi:hypothetical protein